ncbi:hypothetical protein R1sor_026330 [Riccia sorocarpa]|uniref:Uncharacterized protein n=1 Tax=Riccia sorocarpa TaxID=122646 RepID=A0ABD3GB42_9MARC
MTLSIETARARAANSIRSWCQEKGTETFVNHLLKLLDKEYLRTWTGLKHVAFPDVDDLGPLGEIPPKHWRYRFYHGVAAVLGWTERVTVGDPRYWGDELHQAIKQLWPDPEANCVASAPRSHKRRTARNLDTPSTVLPRRLTTVSKFTFSPADEKEKNFTCSVESITELAPSPNPKKKRRLPSWIYETRSEQQQLDHHLRIPRKKSIRIRIMEDHRALDSNELKSPVRKTRVVSSSEVQFVTSVSNSPLKSPVRLCIQQSPLPVTATLRQVKFTSLRRQKRAARSLEGRLVNSEPASVANGDDRVDVQRGPAHNSTVEHAPPVSLRDTAKWKNFRSDGTHRRPLELTDEAELPILKPPSGAAYHGYVTRSLFGSHDSLGPSQYVDRNVPAVCNKNSGLTVIIGVSVEVFTELELTGSTTCFPEFVCCCLLDEFLDDISSLPKVRVRLLQNGLCVETFRSCCEFESRFKDCPNHKCGDGSVIPSVTVTQGEDSAVYPVEGSILAGGFSSNEDSDWSEEPTSNDPVLDSESDSDWETYCEEILEEDLPRLGLPKLPATFYEDPLEWQFADEHWPSNKTRYSHETCFLGSDPEPIPSWFNSGGRKRRGKESSQGWSRQFIIRCVTSTDGVVANAGRSHHGVVPAACGKTCVSVYVLFTIMTDECAVQKGEANSVQGHHCSPPCAIAQEVNFGLISF